MTDLLRLHERQTIDKFVWRWSRYLDGRVLDLGCGNMPYRHHVEAAGGLYHGFDRAALPANVGGDHGDSQPLRRDWDAILCTQVIQYVDDPRQFLKDVRVALDRADSMLVMTGPTNWPVVEREDRWRMTETGIVDLLAMTGYSLVSSEVRKVNVAGWQGLPVGWGVVARRG